MKKIICLSMILLLLSGCGKKDVYYYKEMSETVLGLFQNIEYKEKDYSKKENEAIQKIVSELTHEGQKINVSKFIEKTNEYKTYEQNSKEIFIENDECYIYYQDLDYEGYEKNEAHYEMEPHKRLVCNGYYTILYESDFFPKYHLTQKDPLYNFAYIDYNETEKGYSYIYKSTYDGSYMIVDINTDDMEINLLRNVSEEEIVIEHEDSNPIVLIIIIIIVVASSVFALIKLNQKKKKENYY